MGFEGKVAFVTGGGSGIGAECVRRFADLGAYVVAADINAENVAKVAADAGDNVRGVQMDVTDPDAVAATIADITATEGALHVAVNNAGITGELAPTHELSIEAFRRAIDINLAGVFHGMRAEIPAIINSGGGVIVNTASVAAASGYPYAAAYCASKHGVLGLTRAAGVEYAQAGGRAARGRQGGHRDGAGQASRTARGGGRRDLLPRLARGLLHYRQLSRGGRRLSGAVAIVGL